MTFPFGKPAEALDKATDAAKIKFAFGGFDLTLNTHKYGAFTPYWKPHCHVFVLEAEWQEGREAFSALFPERKNTPSPLKSSAYDGNLAGIAYCRKYEFHRRVTIPATYDDDGTTISRQNTSNQRLTSDQHVTLMLRLNQLDFFDLVYLRGASIKETENGPRLSLSERG